MKNLNLELNPVTDLSWQDGVMEGLKEGPPEFKFSALSRSGESHLKICLAQNNKKKVWNRQQFFYTECWLFLIDFPQTLQFTGHRVEVFPYAKSGSIRRFPACTRITNYIICS